MLGGIAAAAAFPVFAADDCSNTDVALPHATEARRPSDPAGARGGLEAASGAGIVAASAGLAAADRMNPALLGSGAYRYEVQEGWGKLPLGMSYGDAPAVCVDGSDTVYVLTRGPHPVIVLDREGNFLRSFGHHVGMTMPHGASVGPDDALYLTDDFGACVRKFTPDGRLLLTIGTPNQASAPHSGEPFNRCTHTALAPNGDIYVSDGYRNARVHKYDPSGRLLMSWGESGTDPGQFNLVHNICCDADGWVYVADRENQRIQVFDGNGRFETQFVNMARPCGLYVTGGASPVLIVGELGPHNYGSVTTLGRNLGPRVSILSLKGEVLARLGTEPIGEEAGRFIAPHGIAVDSRNDIYVAEVANTYWPILFGEKPGRELRCLQKLVHAPEAALPDQAST